ncbi:MAG: DoxX family protein [Fluviicola sp.]
MAKKIIYWIATIWLALGMGSTGIVQLLKMDQDIERMELLQYPAYLLTLLGVWKILGVIVILVPKLPIVKEWAYAGFFFAMSGAAYSHIASGSPFSETFPSILLLVLTIVSWYFRPAGRRVMIENS